MRLTHAIDPGTQLGPAVATFADGRLTRVTFWFGGFDALEPGDLVVEYPRHRIGVAGKDPNSLSPLIEQVGEARSVARSWQKDFRAFYPEAWKGQLKKPIHHRRLWFAMTPTEHAVVAKACNRTPEDLTCYIWDACETLAQTGRVLRYASASHNLLDAVGLGLFALGRTGRAGCSV